MLRNYINTAWRSLSRNKSFTIINVSGLAVGIAACLLIFLVVHFETSFDNFHSKNDHIYRVFTVTKTPQGLTYNSGVPMPVAEGLRLDYPNMLVAAIFKTDKQITVPGTDVQPPKKFDEENLFFAEPQVFDVFDFSWLAGDKKTALKEPNTVVLSQSQAEKYFGDWKDALNKTIRYENSKDLKVTGVLKNMPANTDLDLKLIVSYVTLSTTGFKNGLNDWGGILSYNYCFVVLPGTISPDRFNRNLDAFVRKHKPADRVNDGLQAIPLGQMHYDSRAGVYSGRTFSKELINVLSAIGIFLVVIASVNFINLATAQAVNRSKEVGIRKVLGSGRRRLMFQFISETFIITLFSIVVAVIISELTLPFLGHLLDIRLNADFLDDPSVLLFLVIMIFGITFLSGFYPALVLSGFNPITALKNRVLAGRAKGVSLRRALVVLQFGIAQVLLIGMLVIVRQMDYFRNLSLGFDKEAVVNLPIPNDSISHSRLGVLRNQLLLQPGVKDVSYSYTAPSEDGNWLMNFKYNNADRKTDFYASLKWADADYFKLYKLQFVAGGPFDKSEQVHGYVVNETLLRKLGVRDPKDAIGKYINIWDDKTKYAPIVGVVKDFNVSSLKQAMLPVIIGSWGDVYQTINVKLQPGDFKRPMASVEKLWNKTFPNYVYQYQFVDDKIAGFYAHDEQLSSLYKIFAAIAIFISSLGLYGLVSFMSVQRTKEVGIRKTLGASVNHIVYLFSKEFTVLIVIAFIIAAPVGWYLMSRWLQGYTYRIMMGPGLFLTVIISSIAIAWMTVGYKAIKAGLANPVKSLRSE
jgi:putative ABC transport system permease protein